MKPVRVYIAKKFGEREDVFLLTSYQSAGVPTSSFLFSPTAQLHYTLEIEEDISQADLVLVPQPMLEEDLAMREHFAHVSELAQAHRKPALLFIGGDFSHELNVSGYYTLKGTQYRRFLKDNEVIIPPFCEDLGVTHGVTYREKSEKPVVSFCGWAGFDNRLRYLKYLVRLLVVDMQKIRHLDASLEVFKKGLYFRRKTVRVLERSNLVKTNFIIRSSFSGNAQTISLSPEQARKEYVQNMIESDFVLAPKGDANYSVRFFEALALGRIPILIDTECCLPLEDVIDYSKCVLKVSYKDINKLPEIVAEFYSRLSNEQFVEMQREARRVYETYLRYDSFFNFVLPRIVEKGNK